MGSGVEGKNGKILLAQLGRLQREGIEVRLQGNEVSVSRKATNNWLQVLI